MKFRITLLLLASLLTGANSIVYAQSQENDGDNNTVIQGNDNVVIENVTIGGLTRILDDLQTAGKSDDFIEIMKSERLAYEEIAKDPVIQSIYAPILENGLFRGSLYKQKDFDYPKPPSLQDLRAMGVVGNFKEFVYWTSGTNDYKKQDRPTWGGLVNEKGGFNSAESEKEYKKRYELFAKLVDIWVKDGLLQP